ncbi:MAG: hypothetical protein ACKVI3_06755 [Verrucomicrobiia bacterium]
MKTNLTRSFISHIRFNFALVGLLSISFFGSASAQSEESDTIELAPCKVTADGAQSVLHITQRDLEMRQASDLEDGIFIS